MMYSWRPARDDPTRGGRLWTRRGLLGVIAVNVAVLSLAPSALAVSWGPISSRLGEARNGDFFNDRGSSAKTTSEYRDKRKGGSPVYVDTEYYFWQCAIAGIVCDDKPHSWQRAGSVGTPRDSSGRWGHGLDVVPALE